MTIPTKAWLYLCAALLYSLAVWYHGYHNADALLSDRDRLIRWQKWYKKAPRLRGFFYLVERTLTIIADAPDASTCTGLVLTSSTAYISLVEPVGGLYIMPVLICAFGFRPLLLCLGFG